VNLYYRLFLRVAILMAIYAGLVLAFGRAQLHQFLVLGGAFLVVALALGIEAVRDVTTPLKKVSSGIQRALEGDYSADVTVDRGDEIGFLSSVTAGAMRYLARQEAVIRALLDVALGETRGQSTGAIIERITKVVLGHLPVEAFDVFVEPHERGSAPSALGTDFAAFEPVLFSDERSWELAARMGCAAALAAMKPEPSFVIPLANASGDQVALAVVRLRAGRELESEPLRFLQALLGALSYHLELSEFRQAAGLLIQPAEERAVRERVHAAALTVELPAVPGYELAAYTRASAQGTDILWWADRGGRLLLLVGDTLGRGGVAAITKANLLGCLSSLPTTLGPVELLQAANRALFRLGQGAVTASLLATVLEPQTGVVVCANAGHCRPLVRARPGHGQETGAEELALRGPLLGHAAEAAFEATTLRLEDDDTLLCYTDGLSERRLPDGKTGRGASIDALAQAGSAQAQRDQIVAALGDGPADAEDLSLVIVRRLPAAAARAAGGG
jgi:serine phosphatase RsbU (regulator of sigma subunit)